MGPQPFAYLYLSQIPYTGLDLGPLGTAFYWLALIGWSLALAYVVLFRMTPFTYRWVQLFGTRVSTVLNAQKLQPVSVLSAAIVPVPSDTNNAKSEPLSPIARGYSTHEGFKSFGRDGALSIEDIVKGLSRENPAPVAERIVETVPNVEPIYSNVEPIHEVVETIVEPSTAPASVRGFAIALIEGDRAAVFAGLRQQVRGGGTSEQLMSAVTGLLDDVYRSRIDGTACDADILRLTAKLSTPTLEKVVAALATAIDASYSTGVTGAKLALMRALAVLGA